MHTPGPRAEHSLSVAHARQVSVAVVQIGVVPEQVLLSMHCTQDPLLAHAVWPAKLAQSPAAVQPRQVFVAVAQMGLVPEQVALVRHCTHLFAVVLQTEVLPVHFELLVAVHWTQAPLAAHAALFASLSPAQSLSAAQAWHLSLLPQMGATPLQLAAEVHWTQMLVLVSQAGVAPVHEAAAVAVHCTHWPSARQAGRAAFLDWHCKSAVQAVHVLADEQIGEMTGQVVLATHPTQVFVPLSHTGVVPVHLAPLVAVHRTQAPLAAQADRLGSLKPAQSPSAPHD